MDESRQDEVRWQFVDVETLAVCPPLALAKIALPEQSVVQPDDTLQQFLVEDVRAMDVGDPAQLLRKVGQLARARHLRVVAQDAFEQGRARTRHADDEDGLRSTRGVAAAVV